MEEDNDGENATGSPSSGGENGFVHIQSPHPHPDPAVEHQAERLEQDDGVVVTRVEDTVQDEPYEARTTEDAGHDEFMDCPDDLVSSEARSPGSAMRARQQPFMDDTRNIPSNAPEIETEILPRDDEEERKALLKEVSNLHHQLKALSNQQSPTDETGEGGEKSLLPLHEMVNECSKFIEISLNERLQTEGTIRELNATIHMKDKEIEDLMTRVNEQSTSHDEVNLRSDEMSYFEATTDRILSSLVIAIGDSELTDTSISGKLSHLEKSTSLLLEKYHHFLSEAEMLGHCLAEVKPGFEMDDDMESVFFSAREELFVVRRKELELNEKNTHLEYQFGQLMEQLDKNRETVELLNAEIGKLQGEVEQEKTRYSTTKEKLSMAVTKGKALVQQRDSLKQLIAEKTSELERCLSELQEKSTALEAAESRNAELTQVEIFSNSLQEALSQRDTILQKCAEILSLGLPEVAQFPDFESQVSWLVESYNVAKDQFIKIQDENIATKEAASVEIDRLTASLLAESQEKYHLNEELKDLTSKYEGIVEEKKQMVAMTESSPIDNEVLEKIQNLLYLSDLDSKLYKQILELDLDNRSNEIVTVSEELRVIKDEKDSLQTNLQRSEEKASLLREKLSMAVKKGKGLVQERENLKQQINEKNAQIEALMADFQKQESALGDFRDQVAKLESERDHIGQYLTQSNTILQEIIETIDDTNINLPIDVNEPVEKVKWFATYLNECQIAKTQVEQELVDVKDEAGQLASKLTEALTNMKSLEDALSVSEINVSQLFQDKRDFELSKSQAEQEAEVLKEEIDTLNNKLVESLKQLQSLDNKLAGSEKTIGLLTEEKNELEIAKSHVEDELRAQRSKFQEALSLAENRISEVTSEKEEAQASKVVTETELQKVKEAFSAHVSNLEEAKMTIKSLEEAMSHLKTNISQFSQENEKATLLESEIQKLKEEAEQEISNLKTELSACRQELEAKHDKWGPELVDFFGNLKMMLKDESLLSSFKQSFDKKVESLKEIERLVKDVKDSFDTELLQDYPAIEECLQAPTVPPASFDNDWNTGMIDDEFNAEDAASIGSYVGNTLDNLNKKNQILADQFASFSTLFDDMIASLLKKLLVVQQLKGLQKSLIEEHVSDKENMSIKIEGLQGELEKSKEVIQQHFNAKENMSTTIEELQGELEKTRSMYDKVKEENDAFQRRVIELENELEASGNTCNEMSSKLEDYQAKEDTWNESKRQLSAQSILSISAKEDMSATIEELQGELEKTRSLYDKIKEENDAFQRRVLELEHELEASGNTCDELSSRLEDYRAKEDMWNESTRELSAQSISAVSAKEKMSAIIEELQGELEKVRSMYDQIKEENDAFQRRALRLENELEASGNTCNELSSKLEDYRAKEDGWNESKQELSDHEGDAGNVLLSASQIKALFDKIDEITIPFPDLVVRDIQPQDSDPVNKLFYVVDSVNELLDQLTLLTHAKEDLRSTLSQQTLEVDHLKVEFKEGLQNIIQKLGIEESGGIKKPADVAGLLLVLEKSIQGIVLDRENTRFKLVETQKVAKDLSSKVKLLEDVIQSRTGGPDTIQERGVFEAPSLTAGSEISEVDEQACVINIAPISACLVYLFLTILVLNSTHFL
ncbi:hypothetical protein CTI12_AA241340 [Artemisia annua]|uniref:Uncharacterized protein n=1 Tax=Artemisia annua TaxID=35608 RepID=A0A2U1NQ66_ARTAN|nr:hypothetical protein CTI12_AA241340 [Artemisia annua]